MVEVLRNKVWHHLVWHNCWLSLFTSCIELLRTLLSNCASFRVLVATSRWSGLITKLIITTTMTIHRICEILRLRFLYFLSVWFHVIQHHLFDFISRENRTLAGLLQLGGCKSWPPRYLMNWLFCDSCFRLSCNIEIWWRSQPWIWGQHKWIILGFFLKVILRISFIEDVVTGENISNPVSHGCELQILLILLLLFTMAVGWSIPPIVASISLGWAGFQELSILHRLLSSGAKHWIHYFTAIFTIVVTLFYDW